jgi:hypothetical protein
MAGFLSGCLHAAAEAAARRLAGAETGALPRYAIAP